MRGDMEGQARVIGAHAEAVKKKAGDGVGEGATIRVEVGIRWPFAML